MHAIESNAEAILVAVPMILVLLLSFFRLDEVLAQPVNQTPRRRGFSHRDKAGVAICVEPDGRLHRERK